MVAVRIEHLFYRDGDYPATRGPARVPRQRPSGTAPHEGIDMRVGRRRRAGAGLFALALSLALGTDATALTWTGDTPLSGSGSAWVYAGGMAVSSTTTAHSVYEQYVD